MIDLKPFLTQITKPLHQAVYDQVAIDEVKIKDDEQAYVDLNSKYQGSIIALENATTQINELKQALDELLESPIDRYLNKKYARIGNIAYTGKRASAIVTKQKTFSGAYSVYLNEFITPDAWEVQNFKHDITSTDDYMWMQTFAQKFKPLYRWVDETTMYSSGDEYLYPAETLTYMIQEADCEDCSFMTASMRSEIACYAIGIYHNQEEKKDFGHAFPMFLYQGDLFVVEFTTNRLEIVKLPDPRYDPYFIITKDHTYQVKAGLAFGYLAQWD